jgi:hypothetical protein
MHITDSGAPIWHKNTPIEEEAMKARVLIESASLGPDDLRIAFQAFDGAWGQIAARYTRPDAIEAARMRLATVILSLMPDTKDGSEMRAIAVQEMTKGN